MNITSSHMYYKYITEGIAISIRDQSEEAKVLKLLEKLDILWGGKPQKATEFIPSSTGATLPLYLIIRPNVDRTKDPALWWALHDYHIVEPWSIYGEQLLARFRDFLTEKTTTSSVSCSMTVKIDYYQPPCPKCGTKMKLLFHQEYYCPFCEK